MLLVQAALIQSFVTPRSPFHTGNLQDPSSSILTHRLSRPHLFIRNTQLHAKSGTKKKKVKDGTITVNRQARRNYEVVSTYDAGVSLVGSEVKSIRDGRMNLRDGFVRPDLTGRGLTLFNVHIGKMGGNEYFTHEERRPRPLLLTKEEGRKLKREVDLKGMTIVPLKAYFNDRNLIKIQIGLCKGKNVRDKRNTIKEREARKDANRMIKNFRLN